MKNIYAIDKSYEFKDNDGVGILLPVRLDHDEVMDLAEEFIKDEDCVEVDGRIKDKLDDHYVGYIAQSIYEQWKVSGEEGERTVDDFYDEAWERLGSTVLYYCWPPEFKKDCVRYYKDSQV